MSLSILRSFNRMIRSAADRLGSDEMWQVAQHGENGS